MAYWEYYVQIVINGMNKAIQVSPTVATDFIALITAVLSLATAILVFIALWKGKEMLKEFKLKRFEAICSFYTSLSAHVDLLKVLAVRYGLQISDIKGKEYLSAFSLFLDESKRKKLLEDGNGISKSPSQYFYEEDDLPVFINQLEKILSFFATTEVQIPLSHDIWCYLKKLKEELFYIRRHCKNENGKWSTIPFSKMNADVSKSPNDLVYEHHEFFYGLLTVITDEIDSLTPVILCNFWRDIKKLKKRLKNVSVTPNLCSSCGMIIT